MTKFQTYELPFLTLLFIHGFQEVIHLQNLLRILLGFRKVIMAFQLTFDLEVKGV